MGLGVGDLPREVGMGVGRNISATNVYLRAWGPFMRFSPSLRSALSGVPKFSWAASWAPKQQFPASQRCGKEFRPPKALVNLGPLTAPSRLGPLHTLKLSIWSSSQTHSFHEPTAAGPAVQLRSGMAGLTLAACLSH